MAAPDHLRSDQFPEPIRASEARGNSRPVSLGEYQELAGRGRADLEQRAAKPQGTRGLERHWDEVKSAAYDATREPWGGVTVNPRSGRPVNPHKGYAVTARHPGQGQITVPGDAPPEVFHAAMDKAREQLPQLAHKGYHLGVFRDDDEGGRIDIDPVLKVNSRQKVDEVGAYTRSVGGAYNFRTGNGHFVPHVSDDK